MIASYQKHHSIINQSIPEDEVLDEDLAIIHPLNEVKQDSINYHQIIKNHVPYVKHIPPKQIEPPKPINSMKSSRFYEEIQEIAKSFGEKIPKPVKHEVLEEKPKRLKDFENIGTSSSKKKTTIISKKPSLKTQELPQNDLRKFLKRVSTPIGTKTHKVQSVITPKDSIEALKRKETKIKSKSK